MPSNQLPAIATAWGCQQLLLLPVCCFCLSSSYSSWPCPQPPSAVLSLCPSPIYIFFSSLNKEFGYSNLSVIKEQLVLQHCGEQYLFLLSIWYPRWGNSAVSRDQRGSSLHLPLCLHLCSTYSSKELSIGPEKSAGLSGHKMHSCKAPGRAGLGPQFAGGLAMQEGHGGTSGRH